MATFASFANANSVCASRGGSGVGTNTAMGYQALNSNTTGCRNTAFGYQAMRGTTTGFQSTAVGFQASRNTSTTSNNTAIGFRALYNNTGANNTAVGYRAGYSLTTGASNTFVGAYAGSVITTGGANVILGSFVFGSSTACNNTIIGGASNTGQANNTVIGFGAAPSLSSGERNTIIGSGAGGSVTSAQSTIIVSRGGSTSNSNGHTLWGTSGVDFNWIQCAWSNVSDCRDKTCIQDLDQKLGLNFLRKLNPVSFNWDNRESYVSQCGYEYGQKDGTLASSKKSYGFEAQQVKQVLEELGVEFEALGHDQEKDAYRITYEEMIAPLIKGVQETLIRLETLEESIII